MLIIVVQYLVRFVISLNMAKNIVLLFVGGVAIYGAIMIDLNLVREGQRAAIISKSKKSSDVLGQKKDRLLVKKIDKKSEKK